MRIAINISCLADDGLNTMNLYTRQMVQGLVQQYAQHEFLLVADKPLKHFSGDGSNISIQIIAPAIKGNISRKFWYDVKLPAAIKKFKADVLLHFGSMASLTTKTPQVLVANDLAYLHHPQELKKSELPFSNFPQKKCFAKAAQIVVFREQVKQEMIDKYKLSIDKLSLSQPTPNNLFQPIAFEERESIKDGFADGREYFLFVGSSMPTNNLMDALKAFSLFKKWQKSSMKLLVAGKLDESFTEKINSYKYRDDVVMLGLLPQEQLVKVIAAAYALVCIPSYKGFSLSLAEAMQSGIPIIASNIAALQEIAADAALYATVNDVDETASHMKTLYRDEKLRSQLMQKGLAKAATFSLEKSLHQLMAAIEAAASS